MSDSNFKKPWYKNGLCFHCTGCGECCTGSPGYVWLTDHDIERLANFLRISKEAFLRRYTKQIGQRISLLEDSKNFDCVFFKDRKCSVYTARPGQCRSYPFWPAVLSSEEAWNHEAKYCEGINHPEGKHYSLSEISAKESEKEPS